MTPAEALARARRTAPNVTGNVVREFAGASPEGVAQVAGNLACLVRDLSGEDWTAEEVAALAEGIAGGEGA